MKGKGTIPFSQEQTKLQAAHHSRLEMMQLKIKFKFRIRDSLQG